MNKLHIFVLFLEIYRSDDDFWYNNLSYGLHILRIVKKTLHKIEIITRFWNKNLEFCLCANRFCA